MSHLDDSQIFEYNELSKISLFSTAKPYHKYFETKTNK